MKISFLRWFSLCAGVISCLGITKAVAVPSNESPKLVVVLVVDQLRADFVTRLERMFGDDGFCRIMREGAHFTNAYYSYGSSATGPGHATIATGRNPCSHGIVSNRFFDMGENAIRACVWDRNSKLVGANQKNDDDGRSPKRLRAPTFGDQLKVSDRRSRVFSVALKDRSAILMGGHQADGVYWLNDSTGGLITSNYYRDSLPSYALVFNEERRTEQYAEKEWTCSIAGDAYGCCHSNEPHFKNGLHSPAIGACFPHKMPAFAHDMGDDFYDAIWSTPFGNEVVLDFALRLMTEEKLGKGPAADVLWIGFSSNDLCGHLYGCESAEVMDMTLCTDRQIARLLEQLDKQVGRGRYLFALTSDHGVTTAVPLAASMRLGGELINARDMEAKLNTLLLSSLDKLGVAKPEKIVQGIEFPWVFLDRKTLDSLSNTTRADLLSTAEAFLKSQRGVRAVVSEARLTDVLADEGVMRLAARSYCRDRAGQFYLQLEDYWYKEREHFAGHTTGSTHDRHVPIMLMGPRIKPGRYFTSADPADLAVTLAAVLGIEPPLNATGAVLAPALDTSPPSPVESSKVTAFGK